MDPLQPNYTQIENVLNRFESRVLPDLQQVFNEAKKKTLDLVTRRSQSGGIDFKFVDGLELRGLGDLVSLLRSYLQSVYHAGQQGAADELPRREVHTHTQSAVVRQYQVDVVPKTALNYFEAKALMWKGIIADELLGGIKRVLLGHIAAGGPLGSTLQALEEVFVPYIGNLAALPDQEQRTPYRLETLVRTNTTEAYNAGRKALFDEDPLIVGYRYSAILDTRTTPVCRFLHGKVLPVGDVLDRLSPPRHYNCRSLLLPVIRGQGRLVFITDEEIVRAVQLSGRDFSTTHPYRVYADLTLERPAWEVLASLREKTYFNLVPEFYNGVVKEEQEWGRRSMFRRS